MKLNWYQQATYTISAAQRKNATTGIQASGACKSHYTITMLLQKKHWNYGTTNINPKQKF